MQPPPQALVLHLSPPLSSPANDLHVGTWRPYSNAADFDANATIILAILLCVLVCVLALTAVIRCFFRHSRRQPQLLGSLPESEPPKLTHADVPSMTEMAPRTLVFSEWMKLAGAQAECAICLSEFLNGEEVRVLPNCRHGFHVKCIDVWLSSHDSCLTCRSNCLTTAREKNQELHEDDIDVESPPELPRMEPEQP